jgi:molybdopterin molybdotransferase
MRPPLHPVDDVLDQILANVDVTGTTESVQTDQALGRYLAADVSSPVDVPPAANSEMDGYAYDGHDPSMVAGGVYDISDRIPAGSVGKTLVPGTLTRIFTGAHLPEGANTVVMQEDTTVVNGKVQIDELPAPGQHVRPQGQDIETNEVILKRGRRLRPEDLGLVASVGLGTVEVYRPLTVAVVSTGDELVEPGDSLGPGQIYNSNRYVLSGLLRSLGMQVLDLGITRDSAAATRDALQRGAQQSDCIICSGGVSVGEEDYVKAVVEEMGSLDVWRLAIKPGKPLAYGQVLGTPFFGLPGNPVSVYVTFLIVARPFLIAMQGGTSPRAPYYFGTADFETRAGNRREYLRVQIAPNDKGEIVLSKFKNQSSGVLSSVTWADGLAEVEIDQHIRPGDRLKYFLV